MKRLIILTCILLINVSIASEFERIDGTESYTGNRNDCRLVNDGYLEYSYFKFSIDSEKLFILEADSDLFSWLKIEQPLFNENSNEYINYATISGNENDFELVREYHDTHHGFKSTQNFKLQDMGTHHRFTAISNDINESMNGHDTCSFTVDLKQIKK